MDNQHLASVRARIEESFQEHSCHTELAKLLSSSSKLLESQAWENSSDAEKQTVASILLVAKHWQGVLASANPALVLAGQLNEVDAELRKSTKLVSHICASRQASMSSYVGQAQSIHQNLVSLSLKFAHPDSRDSIAEPLEQTRAVHSEALRSVRGVEELARSLELDLNAAMKAVTDLQASVDSSLEEGIQKQKTFLSDFIKSSKSDFESSKDSIESEYRDGINEFLEGATMRDEAGSRRAQSLLEEIESHENKAKELLGMIGEKALSWGYQEDADGEKKEKRSWEVVTGTILLAMFIWGVASPWVLPGDGWRVILVRWLPFVPLYVLVGVSIRSTSEHRRSEREHRHKHIALAALEPFLRDMDEAKKNEVRYNIASSFFVERNSSTSSQNSVSGELKEVLGRVRDIQKLVKD